LEWNVAFHYLKNNLVSVANIAKAEIEGIVL